MDWDKLQAAVMVVGDPRIRLSHEIAAKIRAEYAKGRTTHRKLAAKYGVGETQIQKILAGERWKFDKHG